MAAQNPNESPKNPTVAGKSSPAPLLWSVVAVFACAFLGGVIGLGIGTALDSFVPVMRTIIILLLVFLVVITFCTPKRRCPRCTAPVPRLRWARNLKQLYLGGWTCGECGSEVGVNIWGKPLAQPHDRGDDRAESQDGS